MYTYDKIVRRKKFMRFRLRGRWTFSKIYITNFCKKILNAALLKTSNYFLYTTILLSFLTLYQHKITMISFQLFLWTALVGRGREVGESLIPLTQRIIFSLFECSGIKLIIKTRISLRTKDRKLMSLPHRFYHQMVSLKGRR